MSALSAVDIAISDLDEEGYPVDDLREALGAFAELVEAAAPAASDEGMDQPEIDRLRAALARVKGGAA